MRTLKFIGTALAVLVLAALGSMYGLLRASLPQLDGRIEHAQIGAPVRIARDARGVPTIEAADRLDLAFGSGFVHAQDRFFQMDLSRRLAAGELSELFGEAAVEQDRRARLFRFRAVARAVVAAASPAERAVLDAYTRGINAGLGSLRVRPWEYWVLRQPPRPWRDEDTVLVVYTMWWDLQVNGLKREMLRQEINARLGGPDCAAGWKCALRFLYPEDTSWDAPAGSLAAASAPVPVPDAPTLNVRESGASSAVGGPGAMASAVGSNNWAVAGSHTASGAALIANDMHLAQRVPTIWYHARLRIPAHEQVPELDLNGVTLPGVPLLVAGSNGHIAWTIFGRIPQDTGPERARGGGPWTTPADHPRIVDPALGRLWTANGRVATDPRQLQLIGGDLASLGAEYDLGARAAQIRDDLLAISAPATPADMLHIQLDDRAVFLSRWRVLLLDLLDAQALHGHPQRAEFRDLIERWNPRASVDSVGYRLVRAYHDRTRQAVWDMLLGALRVPTDDTSWPPPQFEGPLWQLLTSRPLHLLSRQYPDWAEFLRVQLDATIAELAVSCPQLAHCTWGARNVVQIRHPLSRALPWLASWLDMPTLELPGDHDLPRVQDYAAGASERFAVSPGHEDQGYLHIPGGQSGHPLSPYYRAGFREWALGEPLPFLPGPVQHTLTLAP